VIEIPFCLESITVIILFVIWGFVYVASYLIEIDWGGVWLGMRVKDPCSYGCRCFGYIQKWLHEVVLLLAVDLSHGVSFDLHSNDYITKV
jgi:hypothetical protein